MKDNFINKLEFAFFDIQGSSGYSLERKRPYDGQPHTDSGQRGKTEVKGLTMRDIKDCMVKAFLDCGGLGDKKYPVTDDVYSIDLKDIDPVAVMQNTTCWIEKYMGIFPNVSKLTDEYQNE